MKKICTNIVLGLMFCLCFSGALVADSLSVSPAQPTTSDSVRITIVIPNWNCCTQYIYDSTLVTLVGDTAIMLYYQYLTPSTCPMVTCPNLPKLLAFKRGPLHAGKYSVWETKQLTCTPPLLCAPLPVIQKIGEFTVTGQSSVAFRQAPMPLETAGKTPGNERIYNIRGALVSMSNGNTPKKMSGIYFTRTGAGVIKKTLCIYP